MDDFIYKPTSTFTAKTSDKEDASEFFTLSGLEDSLDDQECPKVNSESKKIFAKKTTRKNGSIKYSIRLNSGGKLSNPASIYGQEKDLTFLDRICRSNDRFKEVNKKVFDLYMEFLKTKNTAYLNNAERENQ